MSRTTRTLCLLIAGSVAAVLGPGCSDEPETPDTGYPDVEPFTIELTSSAFEDGEPIGRQFAYRPEGRNVSPPLAWTNLPEGTEQLVLIVDDPDAPYPDKPRDQGPWVHWLLYGLDGDVASLPERIPAAERLDEPVEAIQGTNDFGEIGYGGPFPPPDSPAHRYFFTLYALREALELEPGLSRKQLLKAIEGYVLAKGRLIGTYER